MPPSITHSRISSILLIVAATTSATAGISGCSGGGSSGGAFDAHGELLTVTFPDPSDVNPEPPDESPQAAPLLQRIVLTFSARPNPDSVSSNTLPVRDEHGFPVPGSYRVEERVVTFTPRLPTRPATAVSESAYDTGGTGLEPQSHYTVRVSPSSFPFVTSVAPALAARFPDSTDLRGVLVGFTTTDDPAHFLAGLDLVVPRLVEADPANGTTGISPNLYTDPEGRFTPRRSFRLAFDAPLQPALENVSDQVFHLIDLDDRPAAFPAGLPLGVDVEIVANELDRAEIEVVPSGILPFGHLLALEIPSDLKGISESGAPGGSTILATTFAVAEAPAGPVRDDLREEFDTDERSDPDVSAVSPGSFPARWDVDDSNVLQADFAFQGNGVLGRFVPPAPPSGETKVIVLDTSRQAFPLFDGSTPDAPPGFEVVGGVFPFTDVDIPFGVVLQSLGNNPLVLTATGTFRLAGEIALSAQDGTGDHAYDSAVSPVPGGAPGSGGGRGGEGQPILFFPPDQVSVLNLVSPPHGGRGFGVDPADGLQKQIGGIGGQSGILDRASDTGLYSTDQEISCLETNATNSNGVKPPGGGGGSLLRKGLPPRRPNSGAIINGIGNVLVDGQGHFQVRPDTEAVLLAGDGGDAPFFDDGDGLNNFIGASGQVQRIIGGQGGGAGATRTESYYCGIWCERDVDPANDGVCDGTDFGKSPNFGDSVGDARGGGAGGGGGAVLLQALGAITLEATARIRANGGNGGGGEQLACSSFAGGGAGGSGGAVLLQSGTSVVIQAGARLEVVQGVGDSASDSDLAFDCDEGGNDGAIGDGGDASPGLIQLQVPAGATATVVDPNGSLVPVNSWVDPTNTLNPAPFTPRSVALSNWFDLGRVTQRAPPGGSPLFSFGGLDALGYVMTDGDGDVLDPAGTDITCDWLGRLDPVTRQYIPGEEPREDFIPPGARVQVEFQGADALVEGSKEVDPGSLTPWSATPSGADGRQFLRWRVTFVIADATHPLGPDAPLPVVQQLSVHANF